MRTNQIYIARNGKSGMHVLVRILAVDDIGTDYLPIDPDDFNKLMMARDARSLVLTARDLGPMYISADSLSRRTFIPSHLQQNIEYGFNLVPSDFESLLSECYFDPYALPVEADGIHTSPLSLGLCWLTISPYRCIVDAVRHEYAGRIEVEIIR